MGTGHAPELDATRGAAGAGPGRASGDHAGGRFPKGRRPPCCGLVSSHVHYAQRADLVPLVTWRRPPPPREAASVPSLTGSMSANDRHRLG